MGETNEERLETTKNSVLHARNFIGEDGILKFQNGEKVLNDFDWVIERVQELEREIERYKKFSGRMQLRNDNLAEGLQDRDEEIAQKNEALAFYANHDNFKTFDSPAVKDCGEKARQALEGTK